MAEQIINIERADQIVDLFGSFDENVKLIEKQLDVTISTRESALKISGLPENVSDCSKVIDALLSLMSKGEKLDAQNVNYVISLIREGNERKVDDIAKDVLCVTAKGKPIKAKTLGQKDYIEAICKNTITLGIGPAGTGKTYLAVAAAVAEFRKGTINRIILTRPAVEAGEKLGFLPGDLQNKVDPYLRPLYDALFDMMGADTFHNYMEKGNIEVAPLAYMRGRTLDDSFIILDEAQNTTPEQMKMFLTRIGFNSKAVVTGDVTQIDLSDGKPSGLRDAMRVLKNLDGIAQCVLTEKDVVRHELVQRIVKAYEEAGGYQQKEKSARRAYWEKRI